MKKNNKLNVEEGGCSAKFSPNDLHDIISQIPSITNLDLLVGRENFDDAAIWKLNQEQSIVQTVDFFPALCEEPYSFGQIAAANAVSDVYAMGGKPIFALNIVMFPAEKNERCKLKEILRGGGDKLKEAGVVLAGGHTIKDEIPKYGLTVTGICHPEEIITNGNAKPGEVVILTKALGTGIALAGKKVDEISQKAYQDAIDSMSQLNNIVDVLHKYNIKCATDITGFGLIGHVLEVANASCVEVNLYSEKLPVLPEVYELIEIGCLPCALFKNLESFEDKVNFSENLDYNLKMLCYDAQTSGGILFTCKNEDVEKILTDLHKCKFLSVAVIGEIVESKEGKNARISVY
jgi:selenide, water dikinase